MSSTALAIAPITRPELRRLNERFESAHPLEIIQWAVSQFGNELCMTTSFTDTLLIDLATEADPDIEVIFLDTGFHFAETLDLRRRAMVRYGLNLTVVAPDPLAVDLWAAGTEACCQARKVEPLERTITNGHSAWLSGLRRSDDPSRADTPIVEIDKRGLIKVNPLAAWPDADVDAWIADRGVLLNDLLFNGYDSIGCWPCTDPSLGNGRSGRWSGSDKVECGIHL